MTATTTRTVGTTSTASAAGTATAILLLHVLGTEWALVCNHLRSLFFTGLFWLGRTRVGSCDGSPQDRGMGLVSGRKSAGSSRTAPVASWMWRSFAQSRWPWPAFCSGFFIFACLFVTYLLVLGDILDSIKLLSSSRAKEQLDFRNSIASPALKSYFTNK